MDIRKENQYNQSMGKYKILSTAAGVRIYYYYQVGWFYYAIKY